MRGKRYSFQKHVRISISRFRNTEQDIGEDRQRTDRVQSSGARAMEKGLRRPV